MAPSSPLPPSAAQVAPPDTPSRGARLTQLDGVRGLAAVYIILHNWAGSSDTLPLILKKGLLSFGQETVMVFFLLSGFVIYWSSIGRPQQTFYKYFIRRFRRIYFPFIVSLLLVFAIAVSNQGLLTVVQDPDFWTTLGGNLLMLQEISTLKPGAWFEPFLGNLPAWSLTYEWWFYLLFFPVYRRLFRHPARVYIIGACSLAHLLFYIQYPNLISLIFIYFSLWWSGVELAANIHRQRLSWQTLSPSLLMMFAMATVALGPIIASDGIRLGYYPFVIFRNCMAIAIFLILAKLWYVHRPQWVEKILRPFETISPISYSLYLFHYPIIVMWQPQFFPQDFWFVVVVKISLLLGLSYLVDIYLQPKVNRLVR